MGAQTRITKQTEKILEAIMGEPTADWWGSRIAPAAGLKGGTIYPALMRMERMGWLSSRWEEIDPSVEGRPRRRLYRLTGKGEAVAHEILGPRHTSLGLAPSSEKVGWGLPKGATP